MHNNIELSHFKSNPFTISSKIYNTNKIYDMFNMRNMIPFLKVKTTSIICIRSKVSDVE